MNPYILLNSIVGLAVFWIFVCYLWREYRVDSFRDQTFAIRDKLFLYAANKNVSFDHPAYTILRDRMNVGIRFAHEFTMTRLALVLMTHNVQKKSHVLVKWEKAVTELPEATQRKLRKFNAEFSKAMFQHLVYISFIRYLIARPIAAFDGLFFSKGFAENRQIVSTVERLESDALEQEEFTDHRETVLV